STVQGPGWRNDPADSVGLYEVSTGKQVGTLGGSVHDFSVAVSPDGQTAVSGGHGTVRVWDLASGKLVAHWKTGQRVTAWGSEVFSVPISPDGRHCFSASFNGD